jgi:hypothetical protein
MHFYQQLNLLQLEMHLHGRARSIVSPSLNIRVN